MDKDVIAELKKNNQLAFSYCDAAGRISEEVMVTPNGSIFAAAGICNPAGNVIALMPHPERTDNGKPYFDSLRKWVEKGREVLPDETNNRSDASGTLTLPVKQLQGTQIFIDTIIVNNEERTVEQTARKYAPSLRLKQWKYLSTTMEPGALLADLSTFNPNKERAYVRRGGRLSHWNSAAKREEALTSEEVKRLFSGVTILRRDVPDTGGQGLGGGGATGICYCCNGISTDALERRLLEVFGNPHASELHLLEIA